MNPKVVVMIALGLIVITTFVAPYRFAGHTSIVDPQPVSGTLHRAVWNAPKRLDIEFMRVRSGGENEIVFVNESELDSGQLALWWFGIALLAGGALFLTRPTPTVTGK